MLQRPRAENFAGQQAGSVNDCGNISARRLFGALGLWLLAIATGGQARGATEAEGWTLPRAVEYAQEHSPDARIAEARVRAARGLLEQARADFWPRVQLQSSYTYTDNPMLVFGSILNQKAFSPALDFNRVPDTDNLNVQGVVTAPLYAGGRIRAGRAAAEANAAAAGWNAQAIRNMISFEVARTYHTILKAREFVQAAEAGVRAFEGNVEIARHRVESGAALKTEVLDLEVRLAQAREERARARNSRALAERALRTVLGLADSREDFTVSESPPEVSIPADDDFSKRPELDAIEAQQTAAEARVRQAKAGYRPRVSLFGSANYDQGWRSGGDGRSYSGGVVAQWDLWDGHRTRGQVDEAEAQLSSLREEERKLRLGLKLEVEQARLRLAEAEERLAVTAASVAQAAESVELTRARFEQGLMLSTQLIDAETALIAARVRRAEAEADRRIAIAALRQSLGLPQLDSGADRSAPEPKEPAAASQPTP